ncbi:DoxX family membrane protein [Microbacterium pseudoresistens]|uniref:Thiosulfate dehydrogenase [quinone] large subunit n=1 Tax=Microbacterium pseudoresistens TaxID=640634 RepID=A0A7Y9EUT8_9MICO|nr:hypothetical protein [Microbacterium pseudoresistens]NYD54303.1 thiosulfate dehydrogenase [quinone] large subunit [Microbacterium pseudoresistens]
MIPGIASRAALVSSLIGGAARVAAGALWIAEGALKHRAGFGGADILLVAGSTSDNARVPFFFAPLGAAMRAAPELFGIVIPALEIMLGVLLVVGTGLGRRARAFTTVIALGSIATLMLYWSSDQLIWQYPALVMLSAIVLAVPHAGLLGVPLLWQRRRILARQQSGRSAGSSTQE